MHAVLLGKVTLKVQIWLVKEADEFLVVVKTTSHCNLNQKRFTSPSTNGDSFWHY
jgi:hypothetical protein